MTRAAMLAALIVGIAMQPAAAEPFYREDLRIPMETAGPRGLEAMLLRPLGTRRYPVALISLAAAIARQRARGICRLSLGEPAQGLCGLAKGAFAFRSEHRSTREAAEAALAACAEYAPDCALYAVDDHLAKTANAGSR
jgi:hypothetical protein